MKKVILLLVILPLITKTAVADELFKFVEFTCIPEANYLKVRAEEIYNIGAYNEDTDVVRSIEQQSNLNLVSHRIPFNESCTIAGRSVQIELNYREPQPRGECGAELRALLRVSIDDNLIIDGVNFHTLCFPPSITELDFSKLEHDIVEICGLHRIQKPFKDKNLCGEINLGWFENELPLDVDALLQRFSEDYLISNSSGN